MRPSQGVVQYFNTWLKVATGDKVICELSALELRVKFVCLECDRTLTLPATELETTVVPYDLQEFVRIHAHRGGHNDKPEPTVVRVAQKTGRRFR